MTNKHGNTFVHLPLENTAVAFARNSSLYFYVKGI